ncbi:hypothetical protein EJB05_38427 [Eragrostis curvula]|uniref:BHLH domain-containing protein n=1 Tax=Eragrostis curvula TaxID=38414 RepID=A0A5J9TU43_9POAL|nr:hypothetical protein EJB05_38427 [Eragrostis curvula]
MALPAASSRLQEEPQQGKQLRNQLAAAVRSINWTYAVFWSVSSTHPGVLTWTDGFYNGEIKTRKIANSAELTADELVMQRSEQLRELYRSLLSGECDHRAARPVAALSPDELGETEWYYVVCMTYAFRPGQGLPGKSFASNEHVWLCNAHLADSKIFPRLLLAKTVVCIPLMSGVLELGTTDSTFSLEPSSSPSANRTSEADDRMVFEDLDRNDLETMIAGTKELGDVEILSNASLEHATEGIVEFYNLCEELDVQPLEDDWIMDGSFEIPCSPAANNNASNVSTPVDRLTSFMKWTGAADSDEVAVVPVVGEPQKLLKKVVAGGAWENSGGGGSTTRSETQESGIKNHVMSERRRREKLNEMFLVLKSLVPTIHKVDKASILAETIAYLKELKRRVEELESTSREPITTQPSGTTRLRGRGHGNEMIGKRISGAKRKALETEHHWVPAKVGSSNVTVTVTDKDVLLEVQCRWEALLISRVFDAMKTLHLDVLSVQASTPDGFMGLKIRAQATSSAAIVPWMISEAIRNAIDKQ